MRSMIEKNLFWMTLALAVPLLGQYKTYSDWAPTNEDGVEYQWVVDDLSPSACTVHFHDLYQDGTSTIRVMIAYRNRLGFHIYLLTSLDLPSGHDRGANKDVEKKKNGTRYDLRDHRMLVGCAFVDRLSVEHVVRR